MLDLIILEVACLLVGYFSLGHLRSKFDQNPIINFISSTVQKTFDVKSFLHNIYMLQY